MKNRHPRQEVQKRLARACRRMAELIEHRERPMRIFGRNSVFNERGGASCPFGHVLQLAGLRPPGPYRMRAHKDAAWVPVYTTNEGTYEAVTGVKPDRELEELLWVLGANNGAITGQERRVAVVTALHDVAQHLEAA